MTDSTSVTNHNKKVNSCVGVGENTDLGAFPNVALTAGNRCGNSVVVAADTSLLNDGGRFSQLSNSDKENTNTTVQAIKLSRATPPQM